MEKNTMNSLMIISGPDLTFITTHSPISKPAPPSTKMDISSNQITFAILGFPLKVSLQVLSLPGLFYDREFDGIPTKGGRAAGYAKRNSVE